MSSRPKLRRALGKPPGAIARRIATEAGRELETAWFWAARRGRGPLAASKVLPGNPPELLADTCNAVGSLGAWGDAVAFARADAEFRQAIERRAAPAHERRVEVFGEGRLAAGAPPRWNVDLHTGHSWPSLSHRRIDYVNRGRPSDVKVPWELSRLRYGVALAQAVAVLDDQQALSILETDLRDWRACNPVGWSVNWTCAMEVALRAVNLITIDGILLAAGSDRRDRFPLLASLYQHGLFLARNLEISDLNGNHFLADAVGLVWLGQYFAGHGEAESWLDTGVAMVREAAVEQVLPDGLDHEGSLPYHVLVLEMFLVARAAAPRLLAALDPLLRKMLDAALAFTDRSGRVPDIGDNDSGRVLALSDWPAENARRVLALGAALVGHDDAAHRAGTAAGQDVLWLLGRDTYRRLALARPAESSRATHLSVGGIVVLGEGEDHVVVDVGPVGFRGRGGHGHLDAMSFEASLGGHLAIRDSGTGSYTGDTALRNELRDCRAHSRVVIDGLPYAQLGGPDRLWAIYGDRRPEVLAFETNGPSHLLVSRQALPARAGEAIWTRTVKWEPGSLEISDKIEAPAAARIEVFLQLPPGCRLDGGGVASEHHAYELDGPPQGVLTLEECRWSPRYRVLRQALRAVVRTDCGSATLHLSWRVRCLRP